MMKLRPIIVDSEDMILGGNMRYKALKELGYKEIPDEWVKRDGELTEAEKQRFIIADNIAFGEYDQDILSGNWNKDNLIEWGLELGNNSKIEKQIIEIKPFRMSHILISYPPELHSRVNNAIINLFNDSEIEIERSSN